MAEVTCEAPYAWTEGGWTGVHGQLPGAPRPEPRLRVVAYDFGVKRNILRHLVAQGFDVTVVPARTSAAETLAHEPDAVFLSNGPGDPRAVEGVPEIVPGAFEEQQGAAPQVSPVADRGQDPVRMYLREMGVTLLLDRHGELEIAS